MHYFAATSFGTVVPSYGDRVDSTIALSKLKTLIYMLECPE